MTKLIVGCGYLGLRVAMLWRADGHHVFAMTRSRESADRFQSHGIEPLLGNVMRPETLIDLPEAETLLYAVGFDRMDAYSRRQIYVEGLNNVLSAQAGRTNRLIYISSTSVYGEDQGEWVDEATICNPKRPNGQVCLDAESMVWQHFTKDAAQGHRWANVLRLSGLYGPGRLLTRVDQLTAGQPIGGNPDAFLNLIHVDDAARAVLACEARGIPGATYIVSDDQPLRRWEYYETLARLVGAPHPRFTPVEPDDFGAQGLNKRCRNRAMRTDLRVDLVYPTVSTGLPQALGA